MFYTYILFTAENNLVFLFAVPLLLIITVYNDTRCTILINIGIVLESLIVSVLGAKAINQNLSQKLNSIRLIVQNTKTGITEIYGEMGKAGQDFSVVASQVSEMSILTKDATENITGLIHNAAVSLNEVTDVIGPMAKEIEEEVCALANEATSSEENNVGILDGISVKMQLLVEKNQSSDT